MKVSVGGRKLPCHGSQQISKFHGGGNGNDTEATLNPPIWNTVICGSIFRYARPVFSSHNIRAKTKKEERKENILSEEDVKKCRELVRSKYIKISSRTNNLGKRNI